MLFSVHMCMLWADTPIVVTGCKNSPRHVEACPPHTGRCVQRSPLRRLQWSLYVCRAVVMCVYVCRAVVMCVYVCRAVVMCVCGGVLVLGILRLHRSLGISERCWLAHTPG